VGCQGVGEGEVLRLEDRLVWALVHLVGSLKYYVRICE
jgi:hypothetical protein